ncbi:MAG TPA: hypothetical protein VGL04_05060 [Sporichthyaceae bacterium]
MAPVLPVVAALRPLLSGGGLRKGSTVEVGLTGPVSLGHARRDEGGDAAGYRERVTAGGSTLALLLLAEASATGSWCALVGAPGIGLAAAAEAGVDLARLALIPAPGRAWSRVVGALVDGFDLVAVRPPERFTPGDARALAGRARHHGSVLVSLGPWPGADLRLSCDDLAWAGLGAGHGRLRSRRLQVSARGRGVPGAERSVHLHLPPLTSEQQCPRTPTSSDATGIEVAARHAYPA